MDVPHPSPGDEINYPRVFGLYHNVNIFYIGNGTVVTPEGDDIITSNSEILVTCSGNRLSIHRFVCTEQRRAPYFVGLKVLTVSLVAAVCLL